MNEYLQVIEALKGDRPMEGTLEAMRNLSKEDMGVLVKELMFAVIEVSGDAEYEQVLKETSKGLEEAWEYELEEEN